MSRSESITRSPAIYASPADPLKPEMKARRSSACEGYSLESNADVVRYNPEESRELASYEHLR